MKKQFQSKARILVAGALAALSAAGCTPVVTTYATVSTHTLQVATDKSTDVVWLQQLKNNELLLMRCFNAAEGPQCVRAKTP